MPSFKEFAKRYAERIVKAVDDDSVGWRTGRIKSASVFASSHLGDALKEIGQEFEGLIYTESEEPLSEEDKQKIADDIAGHIGWNRPRTLRRLIKGGSVDALLQMSDEMEALFMAVKK